MNTNRDKLVEEKTTSPNKTTDHLTAACTPKTRCLSAFLVAALLCFTLDCLGAGTPALTQDQQSWLNKANRHEKAGWVYVHVEGSPRERGFQYGYLLAREIAQGIKATRTDWEYASATKWSWLLEKADVMFVRKIDKENLVLLDNGLPVTLWEFDAAYAGRLKAERTNSKFLPGVPLPEMSQG